MDHKKLLKDLGGEHAVHTALVARGISLTPVAVRAWALTDRAIPAKYWAHIKEIAAAKGLKVSLDDLAEEVRVDPKQAA